MKLPQQVLVIRDRYVAAYPVPSGGPNPADESFENRCRTWIRGMAEQIVFETQDPAWGCKNAGGGRPQSKDALAHQGGMTLLCWDMLFGVGTGSPSLVQNPDSQDITGQTFMPVQGKDNIGGSTGGGGGENGGGGDSDDIEALKRTVAIQGAQIQGLNDQIGRLEAKMNDYAANPDLHGKVLAFRASDGLVVCSDRNQHNHLISNRAYSDDRIGAWEEFVVIDRGRRSL